MAVVHDDPLCTLHLGDCVEVMRELPAESVDAIVTDPPYSLGFMGKAWDRNHEHDPWAREAFRVAKPGAHLLAFGGTRTYHRLASAIEDAGWEIRDCLVWAYASGFPKSLNIGNGMGTALKPAWEPIVMARKPLRGTVAATVLEYGTGALNISATRIGVEPNYSARRGHSGDNGILGSDDREGIRDTIGRWPANLLLTDALFDGDTPGVVGGGAQTSGYLSPEHNRNVNKGNGLTHGEMAPIANESYGDSGTYSRFFLVPKSSRSDREPLVRGGLEATNGQRTESGHSTWCVKCGLDRVNVTVQAACQCAEPEWSRVPKNARANVHPTVKPLDLMRHLVRLVTPPGGTVLDCFLGSGTTAIAANAEGFRCIGIEREREYLDIALARLAHQPLGLAL